METKEFIHPAPDDWRRQGQEKYLTGITLVRSLYRPYRPGWDHDHCEFCGNTFSLREGDLKEGYTTKDHYRWICIPCFTDFKDEFNWHVIDELKSVATDNLKVK